MGVGNAHEVELAADEQAGVELLEAELRVLVEPPPDGEQPVGVGAGAGEEVGVGVVAGMASERDEEEEGEKMEGWVERRHLCGG